MVRTLARKPSNAENAGVRPKATSPKVARSVSHNVFRDASARRRNRVLSGLKAPRPDGAVKHMHAVAGHLEMPTPPTSPTTLPAPTYHPAPVRYAPVSPCGQKTFVVPPALPRPPRRFVSREKMAYVDPDGLPDVAVPYIAERLKDLGPLYGVSSCVSATRF